MPRPEEEENEKERNERKLMLAAVYKVSIEGKNKKGKLVRGALGREGREKERKATFPSKTKCL